MKYGVYMDYRRVLVRIVMAIAIMIKIMVAAPNPIIVVDIDVSFPDRFDISVLSSDKVSFNPTKLDSIVDILSNRFDISGTLDTSGGL